MTRGPDLAQCMCSHTYDAHADGPCKLCGTCTGWIPVHTDQVDLDACVAPGDRLDRIKVQGLMDSLVRWCDAWHERTGTAWTSQLDPGLYSATLHPGRTEVGPLGLPTVTTYWARMAPLDLPEKVLTAADGHFMDALYYCAEHLEGWPAPLVELNRQVSAKAGVVAYVVICEAWMRRLITDLPGDDPFQGAMPHQPELAENEVRMAYAVDTDGRVYEVTRVKGGEDRSSRGLCTWAQYRQDLAEFGMDDPDKEPRAPWALHRLLHHLVLDGVSD